MRLVLVSSRYGAFTGFPAWSLELRRGGGLRPGWEEERGTWYAWALGFSAVLQTNSVGPKRPSRSGQQGEVSHRRRPLDPQHTPR